MTRRLAADHLWPMIFADLLRCVHHLAIYQYLSIGDLVALSRTSKILYQDFRAKSAEFWTALCQTNASTYGLPRRRDSPYHLQPIRPGNLRQYCEATASLYLRQMTPYGVGGGFWDKALHPFTTFGEFCRFLLRKRCDADSGCSLLLYPDYHRLLRSRFAMWRFWWRRWRKNSVRRLRRHLRIVVIRGRRHRLAIFSQAIASVAEPGDFILLQAEDDPFADRHPWSRFQVAFVVLARGAFQHPNGRKIWKDVGPASLTLREFRFDAASAGDDDDPIARRYPVVACYLQSGRTISAFFQEFGLTFFSADDDQQAQPHVRHSSAWTSMTPMLDAWERHLRQACGVAGAELTGPALFPAFFRQAYSIGLSLDLFWAAGRYGVRLGLLPKNRADLWPVPVRAFDTMTAMFDELDLVEFPDRTPYDYMSLYDPVTLFYF